MRLGAQRFVLPVAFSVAACSAEGPREAVGTVEDAVINGEPEFGRPAVVGYARNGSLCTATIIAVKGNTGYALTAAHCVGADPGSLVTGQNMLDFNAKSFPVTKAVAHPGYAKARLFDIAVLTFSGADANTPTLPVLPSASDNLKSGKSVDVVGYGKTTDSGGQIGIKHHLVMNVKTVTSLRLVYDQGAGGLCSGDSGGPTIYTPSDPFVAGVHSFVSSNNGSCLVEGTDIRASAFLDSFITPTIEGKPIGLQTCNQCTEAHAFSGTCTKAVSKCYQSKSCSTYDACIGKCKTATCSLECELASPAGKKLYDALLACICDDACAAECADAAFCNPPTCGMTVAGASCESCLEASCCAEAQACSKSVTCLECTGALIPGAECADDTTTAAYESCLATSCADACGIAPPPEPTTTTTTGAGSAGGAAETTATTGATTGATGGAGGAEPEPGTPVVVESSCSVGRTVPGSRTSGVAAAFLASLTSLGVVARRRRRNGLRARDAQD
ncbi:MAG: S1 family peptidase [Deltaproteobacteria bacterium]|nr:S1 family peptidase [Deltaproteobacteria bacterium]